MSVLGGGRSATVNTLFKAVFFPKLPVDLYALRSPTEPRFGVF